jgi:hypothetical protein
VDAIRSSSIEWTAKKPITLYDEPEGKQVVGHLRRGEHVLGITSEGAYRSELSLTMDHPENFGGLVVRL